MSTFNDIDIACEKCGHEFRGTIWTAVNARQDPELKDILLGGELNMVMCPECGHVAFQDHFVLYQDPESELVAYIYPARHEPERDTLQAQMLKGFREAQEVFEKTKRLDYDPVLVFGLESLVKMIDSEALRAAQSDVAQAVCEENHIPFTALRPSLARKRSLPRVLPVNAASKTIERASLLEGLAKLLAANPTLDLYRSLQKTVEAGPGWLLER